MFRDLHIIRLWGIHLTATCSQHRTLLLRVLVVYFAICSFSRLSCDLVHNRSKCTYWVLLSSVFFPGVFLRARLGWTCSYFFFCTYLRSARWIVPITFYVMVKETLQGCFSARWRLSAVFWPKCKVSQEHRLRLMQTKVFHCFLRIHYATNSF